MPHSAKNPVILAFDSAGLGASVAVAIGERVLAEEHDALPHGQAERLLPMIDQAIRRAGQRPDSLAIVAVTTGPGSFTGIRVGLAAARGIALATGARLIGVTGFAATAALAASNDFLLVALESRREDLYVQLFDAAARPIGEAQAMLPSQLAGIVAGIGEAPLSIAGDAARRAAEALAGRPRTGLAETPPATALGVVRAALRHGPEPAAVRPLYLRPPDVTLPKGFGA
jgi:tRNA threonylcarbamoyladenosine biosynthesis protein TsaB